jgi:hypothetical protein
MHAQRGLPNSSPPLQLFPAPAARTWSSRLEVGMGRQSGVGLLVKAGPANLEGAGAALAPEARPAGERSAARSATGSARRRAGLARCAPAVALAGAALPFLPWRGLRCWGGGLLISVSEAAPLAAELPLEAGRAGRRWCRACSTSASFLGGEPARWPEERSARLRPWAGTGTGLDARRPGCSAW